MPPEVINFCNDDGQTSTSMLLEGPKYPKKFDVYSFGMVCYEILIRDLLFPQETSLIKIKKKILKGECPPLSEYCPSKLKALIEECWDPEPTNHPSFASICLALKCLKCLLMSCMLLEVELFQTLGSLNKDDFVLSFSFVVGVH